MTFWLLTTEYPPQSGGGISTYCWHTARMLAAHGHSVTVFIPAHQHEAERMHLQEERIRLVYIRHARNPQDTYLGFDAALSYQFSVVLKQYQDAEGAPDYIESQEYLGIAYYPLQRRLLENNYLPNTVFYVTAHAPGFLYLHYNQAPTHELPVYWTGEMEKAVLASADFILSPSQYLLGEIARYTNLDQVTTRVIRNPFSFSPSTASHTHGDIVFFGKLTPQKGCLELLRYMASLWDTGFDARLTLIGGDDHFFYPVLKEMGAYLRQKYGAYIQKGLLVITGHISPNQIVDRVHQAHVVVIPSITDNFPYTLLESMALGRIVLVSAQGGQAEIIEHGKNGFVFSHHEAGSFQVALREIFNLTEAEQRMLRNNALKTVTEQCGYAEVYTAKMEALRILSPKRNPGTFPFTRPRARQLDLLPSTGIPGKLSIVIPYYNMGKFILDCMQSVAGAVFSEKEIIIVNDGSTDAFSLEILTTVAARYPVRIVNQPNQGLSAARNRGAAEASGEFLAFLDADDRVDAHYYEKAVQVLTRYENVSFVGCWAKYFGAVNQVWPAFNPEPPYLLVHNMLNTSALVYKRAHFLTAGKNDPAMLYGMEDYESAVRMVKTGFQGVVLPEALWFYRIRGGSMAASFNRYSELYLHTAISNRHADFFGEYGAEVFRIMLANRTRKNFNNPSANNAAGVWFYVARLNLVNFVKSKPLLRKIAKRIYSAFFAS